MERELKEMARAALLGGRREAGLPAAAIKIGLRSGAAALPKMPSGFMTSLIQAGFEQLAGGGGRAFGSLLSAAERPAALPPAFASVAETFGAAGGGAGPSALAALAKGKPEGALSALLPDGAKRLTDGFGGATQARGFSAGGGKAQLPAAWQTGDKGLKDSDAPTAAGLAAAAPVLQAEPFIRRAAGAGETKVGSIDSLAAATRLFSAAQGIAPCAARGLFEGDAWLWEAAGRSLPAVEPNGGFAVYFEDREGEPAGFGGQRAFGHPQPLRMSGSRSSFERFDDAILPQRREESGTPDQSRTPQRASVIFRSAAPEITPEQARRIGEALAEQLHERLAAGFPMGV